MTEEMGLQTFTENEYWRRQSFFPRIYCSACAV